MATLFKPQIVTSNHLLEGDVIYFKAPAWTRNIEEAKVARSPEEAEKLLAAAKAYPHETVGVEFTEVDVSSGVPRPYMFLISNVLMSYSETILLYAGHT